MGNEAQKEVKKKSQKVGKISNYQSETLNYFKTEMINLHFVRVL